jgi:hypothetical protein
MISPIYSSAPFRSNSIHCTSELPFHVMYMLIRKESVSEPSQTRNEQLPWSGSIFPLTPLEQLAVSVNAREPEC